MDRLIAYYNHFTDYYTYRVYYDDIRSEKSELFREELKVKNIKYEWDNAESRMNWSKKRFEVFFTDSDSKDVVERIILEKCDVLIEWSVSIGGRIQIYSLNEELIKKMSIELGEDGYYTNEAILDDKLVYYLDLHHVNLEDIEKAVYRTTRK